MIRALAIALAIPGSLVMALLLRKAAHELDHDTTDNGRSL